MLCFFSLCRMVFSALALVELIFFLASRFPKVFSRKSCMRHTRVGAELPCLSGAPEVPY